MSQFLPVIIMLVGAFIFFMVYIRMNTQGKILCQFEDNGTTYSKFLKEDKIYNVVRIGKKDDAEHGEAYIIDSKVMTTTQWPGGLPSMMQVGVRTLRYVRGNPAPYGATGRTVVALKAATALSGSVVADDMVPVEEVTEGKTANYLFNAINPLMLRARFESLKTEMGMKGGKGGKYELYILIGVAVLVVVGIYGILTNIQTQKELKLIYDAVHGVTTTTGR